MADPGDDFPAGQGHKHHGLSGIAASEDSDWLGFYGGLLGTVAGILIAGY